MKILLLTHKFSPDVGGIESISEMLADSFVAAHHEIRVVTWSEGVSSISFNYPIIRKPNVLELIRQHQWADVVFENNICLRLSWPAALLSKKSLVGLQTWISDTNPKLALSYLLKKAWLKRAKAVVACSKAIQQGCWPAAFVVGNPYQHNVFKILPDICRTDNFVFVGRLVSDKGADLAIEAFGKFIQDQNLTSAILNIVGDGPKIKALQKQVEVARLQDNVRFLGLLRGLDLVKCLNQHRYILVPSKWKEPFGIVALEGMACGCIPIVADSGGLPDAVGFGGVLFESGNAGSLAATMLRLAKDKPQQCILKEQAANHLFDFSSTKISKQYLSIFESII